MSSPGDSVELARLQFREWMATAWDPNLTVRQWWARLTDSGWGFPDWPTEWFGRNLSEVATGAVREEMARAGLLGPPIGQGTSMAAQAILGFGSHEQRERWLGPLARGEEHWCQFYSEPDAGSDLGGVRTRAVFDGESWVLNGQKVWNSGTLESDRGIILARTDPHVPKHKGLSFFVIDLDQPGIEIKPIRQMNWRTEFNETFFTDARISPDSMIGAPGDGWRVVMATLSKERADFAGGGKWHLKAVPPGTKLGHLDRRVGEVLADESRDVIGHANTPPISTAEQLIDLARRHGRQSDPVIRQRLAEVYALSEALRLTGERAAAAAAAGRQPGAESSIGYVGAVRMLRLARDLAAQIAGPAGLLYELGDPLEDSVAMTVMTVPCHGIQGGSEQIQRNILGERVLGLPKEPAPTSRPAWSATAPT